MRTIGLALTVLIAGSSATAAPTAVNPVRRFSVAIEQDGKEIPIRDHQVTIQRKTFTIVIRFHKPDFVLVNSSFSSASFDAAAQGLTLAEIDGFQGTGMAEDDFNPNKELLMRDDAPHYWHYSGERDHRFNDVRRDADSIVCRRHVARLYLLEEDKEPTPTERIEDTKQPALYLVFAHATLATRPDADPDTIQWDEDQREYVKVILETPTDHEPRR